MKRLMQTIYMEQQPSKLVLYLQGSVGEHNQTQTLRYIILLGSRLLLHRHVTHYRASDSSNTPSPLPNHRRRSALMIQPVIVLNLSGFPCIKISSYFFVTRVNVFATCSLCESQKFFFYHSGVIFIILHNFTNFTDSY